MGMKGFYFSFDSLLALSILAVSLTIVAQFSQVQNTGFEANTVEYRGSNTMGRDAMKLGSRQSFTSLNSSYREKLVEETVMDDEDLNRSILDGLALLWAAQNRSYARETAKKYFDRRVPDGYEYRIEVTESGNGSVIYRSANISDNASTVTSVSRLVSGHRINRPSEGFQARAQLKEIRRQETKTVSFGGYVGDGDIIYNFTLPEYDEIQSFDIEGDFSGPFELYINGNLAGSYNVTRGNITVEEYDICTDEENETLCGSFERDENNFVEFRFDTSNRSIRGGTMQVEYNRTKTVEEFKGDYSQSRKKMPGIDGILNYYSSIYVPGKVQNMNANLHYRVENLTVFLKVGNATVYEERTIGEKEVEISSSEIESNLSAANMSYEQMSQETVPVRFGYKNIDRIFSEAIADSVAVIDNSGSMDGSKLNEAKGSAKSFVNIILDASGNRAGVIGYDPGITVSEGMSTDEESLNNTVDSMEASGGTCIGCGILEAVEMVKQPRIVTKISRKTNWSYNTTFTSSPPEKDGDNWTELEYNDFGWSRDEAILGNSDTSDTSIDVTDDAYFRNSFRLEPDDYESARAYLRADDSAEIYLNGAKILDYDEPRDGKYWNEHTGGIEPAGSNSSYLEGFESSTGNWNLEGPFGRSGGCTTANGSQALVFSGNGDTTLTSDTDDVSVPAKMSYWVRQTGSDCELPDGGEDLLVEYLASDGEWKELSRHPGGGNDPEVGVWEKYTVTVPEDGFHVNSEIRFNYPNTGYYDYWAVDSVNLTTRDADKLPAINMSLFNDGQNVMAAKLENNDSDGEFDLELNLTERRRDSMIVMSDGAATRETSMTDVPDHNEDGNVDAADHSIEAGCRAGEQNVTVYTVGFGSNVNDQTLNMTAECGNGTYYKSDTGELKEVFKNISNRILNASFTGQTLEATDDRAFGKLYADSSIGYNYSPSINRDYGAITVEKSASNFGSDVSSPKTGYFEYPEDTDPRYARLASYSGARWTDRLSVNGSGSWQQVYNLSSYGSDYQKLGDPFNVRIPQKELVQGVNYLKFDTGLTPSNPGGGTPESKVYYGFDVENFVGYGDLFSNKSTARENAEERLKQKLDLNGDGEPVVKPGEDGYNFTSSFISDQPYIWGPANVKLVIWRE